ncbi:MAG: hypothetical protein SPH60_03565 [Alistipes senegalensis]|nr:hypothetical protein [Alistipes senegalensis]
MFGDEPEIAGSSERKCTNIGCLLLCIALFFIPKIETGVPVFRASKTVSLCAIRALRRETRARGTEFETMVGTANQKN